MFFCDFVFFFFSSRRRHTRLVSDWSSDVCSSDLAHATPQQTMHALAQGYVQFALDNTNLWSAIFNHRPANGAEIPEWHQQEYAVLIQEIIIPLSQKIGRASCRERV